MDQNQRMDQNESPSDVSESPSSSLTPKRVKAVYNFKGSNNDELCFHKDDIITLTQTPTGGWWEGTLNSVTGWFPCNYVQPLNHIENNDNNQNEISLPINGALTASKDTDIQQYRSMVFKDIMDTEVSFTKELNETLNKYLIPLQQKQILPESEVSAVIRCIHDICSLHLQFLSTLNNLNAVSHKDLRIGGVFLEFAPQIRNVHFEYCAIHAKFVHMIEQHKKELNALFGTVTGSESQSNVQLSTYLSISFRRIDKYPALLQELQRYTDESHSDRGDTQRAGFVYREISMSCLELRRQKEMELEVMLGNIKNWDGGENIQSFGEIIRMGPVSVQMSPESTELKKDIYLVLFQQILLILSVSSEMDSFVFEAKCKLEDSLIKSESEGKSNSFDIETKDKTNTYTIQCSTAEDAKTWIGLLQKCVLTSHSPAKPLSVRSNTPINSTLYDNQRKTIPSSSISDSSSCSNIILSTPQRTGSVRNRFWSTRSLTPHPPLRISNSLHGSNNNSQIGSKSHDNKLNNNKHNNDDDMMILQVIESYCLSAKTRKATNSTIIDTPQILLADEEKIMVEENHKNIPQIEERGLVDTVYALQEEVKQLRSELNSFRIGLRAEKKARKRLNNIVIEHLQK